MPVTGEWDEKSFMKYLLHVSYNAHKIWKSYEDKLASDAGLNKYLLEKQSSLYGQVTLKLFPFSARNFFIHPYLVWEVT